MTKTYYVSRKAADNIDVSEMVWEFEKVHLFKRSSRAFFVAALCRGAAPFPQDFSAMTSQTVNAPDPERIVFLFFAGGFV